MIQLIIEFLVRLAGIVAMVAIVIAGLLYLISAGSSEMINKSKSILNYVVVGFIVIFVAWTVVNSILYLAGYIDPIGGKWYAMDCTTGPGPVPTPPPPIPSGTPTPTPSISPTPTPSPFPALCTHMVYNEAGQVRGKNVATGIVVVSGTLNDVLTATGKSGNHVCINNGNYSLNGIDTIEPNVFIECESNSAIIKTTTANAHLIYLKSGSTIKGCTFEHNGSQPSMRNIIYVYGNIINWNVIGNHFIRTDDAVMVTNPSVVYPPTNGYALVENNTGRYSRLGSVENGRDIIFRGNKFYDYTSAVSGGEFFDFNGNVHYTTLENNIFENSAGYSIDDEAIDMIGFNTYNVVRNNRIVANFQRAIGPRREASHNLIEGNYIEYTSGPVANAGGIVMWNSGAIPSKIPTYNTVVNNTIIGTTTGIILSGAQNNTVTGNNISKAEKGISITKDTYNGANATSTNNIVTDNTINIVDCGIFIESALVSLNTVPLFPPAPGNKITNFNTGAICN